MPSLVHSQRSPPSTTSWASSRPASRIVLGTVFSAGSMTSQVSFAVSASRSTWAPAAASRSIALGVLKAIPTSASTCRVFSWMNCFSSSLR